MSSTFQVRYWATLSSIVVTLLWSSMASANPEPTAYDTRSVALGLSGVSYLERPAAVAINPANLQGIKRWSGTVLFNPLLVLQTAPVEGPNTKVNSDLGFGPLGSIFFAGRVSPRVVMGTGLYIETGYGSGFKNIVGVDGEPANTDPQDLDVVFFVGEVAVASSIKLSDKLNVGVALRLPFSKQVADLYENIAPAIDAPGQNYQRVKIDMAGVGFPSVRLGITYKPTDKLTLGASYRAYSRIALSGTATAFDEVGPSRTDWHLPHAIQFGGALRLLDDKLMLVLEQRMQFHNAPRSGNDDETVHATVLGVERTIVIPFDWRNVYSTKLGAEYKASDLVDLRLGANLAISATTKPFAQYFTPPPGLNVFLSGGLGLNWEKFSLDLALATAWGKGTIGDENVQPVIFQGVPQNLCSSDQVTRTGCPGEYRVLTFWGSVSATFFL